MDTDEFLAKGLDTDSDDDEVEEDGEMDDAGDESSLPVGKKQAAVKHKKSLDKLKDTDPEFYEFLQKEDKSLLDFDASDVDSDEEDDGDDDDDDDDEDDDGLGRKHKPPTKLEVASDEDDESEDETDVKKEKAAKHKSKLVTLKMINHWSQQMRDNSSIRCMHEAVVAFKAAVHQMGEHEEGADNKYRVEGSAVFNAIVRMCLTEVLPTWSQVLKLPKQKDPRKPVLPTKSDNWSKIKADVKSYLTDLLLLLTDMKESAIVNVLLKHIHQLAVYFVSYPKLAKQLIKGLIKIWSSGEETCRVLAFLSINKITLMMQQMMLQFVLKQMYMSYVTNCKFMSPTELPMVNFMQRTLVEMFAIDVALTYQYAFIYIRQLAIHLRNAITVKKKETLQAVYNWQYIQSLHLWSRLLATIVPNKVLEPLIFPLTQTIIGTIKLMPTARYYPLRFHCVRYLNLLSRNTKVFIPTLPFLLEVLQLTDFNKKHKTLSAKPFNFACILKFSKAQLHEKAFRDGVMEQLYDLFMDSLYINCHTLSFPEVSLPALIQLKHFVKKCKVANFTKQIKQIVEKIQDTSKVIVQRRRSASLNLANSSAVLAWEERSQQEGTPLGKYYKTWRKLRDREMQLEISNKEQLEGEDNLPVVTRDRGPRQATEEDRKEFNDLFDAESDESGDDDETRFMLKEERPKKKQKTKQRKDDDDDDDDDDESDEDAEYSDFDEDELEQLAQSASEDEDEEEQEEEGEDDEDDDEEEDDDDGEDDEEDTEEEDDDDDVLGKKDVIEDLNMSDLESD